MVNKAKLFVWNDGHEEVFVIYNLNENEIGPTINHYKEICRPNTPNKCKNHTYAEKVNFKAVSIEINGIDFVFYCDEISKDSINIDNVKNYIIINCLLDTLK